MWERNPLQNLLFDVLLANTYHVCAVAVHDDRRVVSQHFELLVRRGSVHPRHARFCANALQFLHHVSIIPTHVCVKGNLLHVRDIVPFLVDHGDYLECVFPVAKQLFHVGTGVHGVVERDDGASFFVELSGGTLFRGFAVHGATAEIAEFSRFVPPWYVSFGSQQQIQVVVLRVDGIGQN